MNNFDIAALMLARVIKTSDDGHINQFIRQLETTRVPWQFLQQHNIPFLVDVYCPNNRSARSLAAHVRYQNFLRRENEKEDILVTFHEGLLSISKYHGCPDKLVQLASSMSFFNDTQYLHISLSLMLKLDLSLEHYLYLGVLERARQVVGVTPFAALLVEKIEKMIRDSDNEEGFEEQDENSDNEDSDESFISDSDSGVDSDEESDDDNILNDPEEVDLVNSAVMDVMMKVLEISMRSGDSQLIDAAFDVVGEFRFPLDLYNKYDIASLIYNYSSHHPRAMSLLRGIQNTEKSTFLTENIAAYNVFERVIRNYHSPEDFLIVLVGCLKDDNQIIVNYTVNLLLDLKISEESFEMFNIKEIIEGFAKKTRNMERLMAKFNSGN